MAVAIRNACVGQLEHKHKQTAYDMHLIYQIPMAKTNRFHIRYNRT